MTTDIVEIGGEALDDLAHQINLATTAAEASARAAVEHAIEAGRLLIAAKAQLQHGQWEAWLMQHCTVAPRTARAYMQLCNKVPALPESERQRVAELPLRQAIAAISTQPTAPPTDRVLLAQGRRFEAEAKFGTAYRSLLSVTRDLRLIGRPLKRDRLVSLRKKLNVVLAELDAMMNQGDGGEH